MYEFHNADRGAETWFRGSLYGWLAECVKLCLVYPETKIS